MFGGLEPASLSFNGSAFLDDLEPALVLTPNAEGQAGSSFATGYRPTVADGFVTIFTFRIDEGAGDGLAFVIQDSPEGAAALGGGGSGIGYGDNGGAGIVRSLAVEFDIFSFGLPGEFDAQHVSIQTRCADQNTSDDSASIAHAGLGSIDVTDGQPHTCEIRYRDGAFTIVLDGTTLLSNIPFSFSTCAGGSIVSPEGCALVGFTAATGAATARQSILSWQFADDECIATGITSFIDDQTPMISDRLELTFQGSGSGPFNYFWRRDGVDVTDGGAISGSTTNTLVIDPVGPEHAGHWDYVITNPCGGTGSGFDIAVASGCPADFNADGNLDPDDLSDFITCFFTQTQFPGTCPEADYNADGGVDPDDLSDYITAFFTGCG